MTSTVAKMKYFILVCLVLVESETQAAGAQRNLARIYNGIPATDGQLPYQVLMAHNNNDGTGETKLCGGTLITPKHVLTAGHCVKFVTNPSQYKDVVIVAGHANVPFKDESSWLPLKRIAFNITKYDNFRDIIPQGRKSSLYFDDIAIVELNEPYNISPTVKTISLNDEEVQPGTTCIVSGFGRREHFLQHQDKEPTSKDLFLTKLDVIDKITCLQYTYPSWHLLFENTQFCAIGHQGQTTGICPGDSGGPLVCNGKLTGINSMAPYCGDKFPYVFTKVSEYITWIEDNIKNSGYSLKL